MSFTQSEWVSEENPGNPFFETSVSEPVKSTAAQDLSFPHINPPEVDHSAATLLHVSHIGTQWAWITDTGSRSETVKMWFSKAVALPPVTVSSCSLAPETGVFLAFFFWSMVKLAALPDWSNACSYLVSIPLQVTKHSCMILLL